MSNVSSLPSVADQLFKIEGHKYEKMVFINNAGSLGPLTPIGTKDDSAQQYAEEFTINVTSSCFLTSEASRRFKTGRLGSVSKLVVVNISSLAAVQAFEVGISKGADHFAIFFLASAPKFRP